MVWSNWRGAALLLLACAVPVWSQSTTPTSNTADKFMTVHENGKSQRCKIIRTWRTPEGSNAYQLQVLETREMITVVEDGPSSSIQDASQKNKVKSLSMSIFHWGRDQQTAPPGVPTAPKDALATSPPTSKKYTNANAGMPVVSPGKDQVIWWEEKDGQRVSPVITTSGKNPFENSPTITLPNNPAPTTTA